MENDIMNIIMNAGNARSKCLTATKLAINSEFDKADALLLEAKADLTKAHKTQTKLIKEEISGESQVAISLLMIHAQDHLMNALTVRDLAEIVIQDIKFKQMQIDELKGRIQ